MGYSGTPLVKKLGIKPGMAALTLNAPQAYAALIGGWPDGVTVSVSLTAAPADGFDFIHYFTTERAALMRDYPDLKAALAKDGMLWVSWPKKASKVPTDVTEDVVRDLALAIGLVDVKVAAVDAVWSGLKIVFRLKDR